MLLIFTIIAHINALHLTARKRAAGELGRVCRAWHRACGVEVPMLGEFILSETEGRSRRQGEGQGRHREVGSGGSPIQNCGLMNRNPAEGGMWCTRGESARDDKVLHPQWGCAL